MPWSLALGRNDAVEFSGSTAAPAAVRCASRRTRASWGPPNRWKVSHVHCRRWGAPHCVRRTPLFLTASFRLNDGNWPMPSRSSTLLALIGLDLCYEADVRPPAFLGTAAGRARRSVRAANVARRTLGLSG